MKYNKSFFYEGIINMSEYDKLIEKINRFPNFTIMNEEEKIIYLKEHGLELIDYVIYLWNGYCSKCNEIESLKK